MLKVQFLQRGLQHDLPGLVHVSVRRRICPMTYAVPGDISSDEKAGLGRSRKNI